MYCVAGKFAFLVSICLYSICFSSRTMASISMTSFYGARARAQHERGHMPPREISLNGSNVESEIDEDELEVFEEDESEESDYSSEAK